MNAYGFENIGGRAHYPDKLNLRVWNNDYSAARPVGVHISARVSWTFHGAAAGTLIVQRDHPLADRLMQADYDVVPVTAEVNGERWVGRVKEFVCEGEPGREIVTATLISEYAFIHAMLGWPSTFAPLAVQFPPQDLQAGPLATVALHYITANATRLRVPIYVKRPEGVDRSPWVRRWSRMTPLDELLGPALEEHGYQLKVELWLPGDPDPGPVVNANRLGQVGSELLAKIDNLLRFRNDDNWLGLQAPQDANTMDAPGLVVSIVPKRPRQFVRWTTAGGGITSYRIVGRHPEAHTMIVGGKSPAWVNDIVEGAVDLAISGLLSAAGIAITAVSGGLLGPIVAGVGGIIKDGLSNVALAFTKYTDEEAKGYQGPFAYPEKFVSSGAGTFSLEQQEAALTALQEAKGGRSVQITVADGKPHRFGADERLPNGRIRRGYRVGDECIFEDRGAEIVDYISAVEVSQESSHLEITPTIGDARIQDDPMVRQLKHIKNLVTYQRAAALVTN